MEGFGSQTPKWPQGSFAFCSSHPGAAPSSHMAPRWSVRSREMGRSEDTWLFLRWVLKDGSFYLHFPLFFLLKPLAQRGSQLPRHEQPHEEAFVVRDRHFLPTTTWASSETHPPAPTEPSGGCKQMRAWARTTQPNPQVPDPQGPWDKCWLL